MFKQYAKGSFTCGISGLYHCGPDDTSPKRFDYEVELRYPATALDERGFLLDNLDFRHYFESLGASSVSCELLAKQACEYFYREAGGRAVAIEVSIWGLPGEVRISC